MKKHLRQEYGWKETKKKKKYIRPKNTEIICQECGKTFMVTSNRKKTAKFCSRECSSRNIGRRKQKYILKTKTCPICGEDPVDTYQRIVGYLVPTSSWSDGRKQELLDRHELNLNDEVV